MRIGEPQGTSIDQDSRYFNQDKKLLASMSFPASFDERVDLAKVQLEVVNQWVAERLTQLLGFEDDIVVAMVVNLLEPKADERLDPRRLQLALTGFLAKDAAAFTQELWALLLSAQASPTGIPAAILDRKKRELEQAAADKAKLRQVLDTKRAEADASRRDDAKRAAASTDNKRETKTEVEAETRRRSDRSAERERGSRREPRGSRSPIRSRRSRSPARSHRHQGRRKSPSRSRSRSRARRDRDR